MRSYEGVFVFPPEATADARKAQLKSLDDMIAKFEGSIQQKTEWGKRPFGYPVKKFREGWFVIADFQMNPAGATEFRKTLELQEELIKYMITVKQPGKPEKAPAPASAATPAAAPRPVSSGPSHSQPYKKTTAAPAGSHGATA